MPRSWDFALPLPPVRPIISQESGSPNDPVGLGLLGKLEAAGSLEDAGIGGVVDDEDARNR